MAKRKHKPPQRKPEASSPPAQATRAPDWIVVGLSLLGMGITGYLTLAAWSGADLALCSEGTGCDLVRQSRWSTVLGVPVSLWGFAVYALLALIAYRSPPRLKRWRRLWLIAFMGLAISVYLTLLGLLSLDAVCAWCLASLATLTALFLWLSIRRPETAPGMPWGQWALSNAVVALVVVGTLHAYYSELFSPTQDPRLESLARHLTDTGARYYGAYWCPACQQQHRMFGNASEQLPYVECSPHGRHGRSAAECVRAGVGSYPTWNIRGRTHEGVIEPEDLARYSGFDWGSGR